MRKTFRILKCDSSIQKVQILFWEHTMKFMKWFCGYMRMKKQNKKQTMYCRLVQDNSIPSVDYAGESIMLCTFLINRVCMLLKGKKGTMDSAIYRETQQENLLQSAGSSYLDNDFKH